jgi:hypothetical protein
VFDPQKDLFFCRDDGSALRMCGRDGQRFASQAIDQPPDPDPPDPGGDVALAPEPGCSLPDGQESVLYDLFHDSGVRAPALEAEHEPRRVALVQGTEGCAIARNDGGEQHAVLGIVSAYVPHTVPVVGRGLSGSRIPYEVPLECSTHAIMAEIATKAERRVKGVTNARLDLTRAQILVFRRHIGALNERLPRGARSLRRAAWAGLQDSMPRAALLSIHARVDGTDPSTWEDASLVQLWGPRYSAYVVAAQDLPVFSLGRLPDDAGSRRIAEDLAARLHVLLGGTEMTYGEAGRALGEHPNRLRYAAPTGRVVIRWGGARQPTVRTVPQPKVDPGKARLEFARRYLHVFGPTTPGSFAAWAGIPPRQGKAAFETLRRSLTPVRTPVGDRWILTKDEPTFRTAPGSVAPARFLPSGDAYFLLLGDDRELLVPDPSRRRELWTSRVWPGGLLVAGELVGTWRRAQETLTIHTWRRLSRAARDAVEAEADSLPLPGVQGRIVTRWV